MGQTVLGDRVLQRMADVVLTDDLVEILRAIFPGKNLIIHDARNLCPLALKRNTFLGRFGAAGGKGMGFLGSLGNLCPILPRFPRNPTPLYLLALGIGRKIE